MNRIVLASIMLLPSLAFAQLRVGLESNTQYYVDDDKIQLDAKNAENRLRSNNYLKLDYNWKDFEFGVQLEGYYPKPILLYNPKFQDADIGAVYARYRNYESGIDITAGHMYDQFGSGLALRFWEDRMLGFNNSLFGGRIKLDVSDAIQFKALAGKQRVGMGLEFSDGLIYGADTDINLSQLANIENHDITLGASFVGRNEDLKGDGLGKTSANTFVYGPRVNYFGEKITASAEYLVKSPDLHAEQGAVNTYFTQRSGSAFLINTGYTNNGFALNVNLRRLENFTFFSQRNMIGNRYNYGLVNYVPSLTKQYDHSLQNIYVYQAQNQMSINNGFKKIKLGEIGGQFDMFYDFPEDTFFGGETGANLAINGSIWSGLKSEIDVELNEFGDKKIKSVTGSFFGTGEKYYSDLAVEYRKTFSTKVSGIFSYLNQSYNAEWIEGKSKVVTAHTLAAESTYFITDEQSARFEVQHQWADAYWGDWAAGIIEYIPTSKWSVFVQDMYNYGNKDESKRIHYYTFGGAFTTGSTRVAASYGRQRGGIMCVGGVCRMVPENAGFTLNVTTNF